MRVWLSQGEQQQLVDYYSEDPVRRIAMRLGLHGLRSAEIMGVTRRRFRQLDGADGLYMLKIPEEDAKKTKGPGSNAREAPISEDLYRDAKTYANATNRNLDETLFDVNQRQVRRWLENARDEFHAEGQKDAWQYLSMHDLRRTWATDTYYSLATAGVPSAKELTMSWGGWAMTESGRAVFTNNYLGPVPDHVTVQVAKHLNYL
jgi:integrase